MADKARLTGTWDGGKDVGECGQSTEGLLPRTFGLGQPRAISIQGNGGKSY